ncbi:MAG: SocA family protein [Desulfovibrio sp.]|jgi:uncharacterized phage-associated protein|nr:SocA family protein [Desulfovibrio sp.]
MASVKDVAQCILEKKGRLATIKLQKLVYYCQAWHLAWTGKAMFPETIQAWAYGPVAPDLHQVYGDKHRIGAIPGGDSSKLTDDEIESVDAVLDAYGDKFWWSLVHYTHLEPPWRDARKGVPFTKNVGGVISPKAMQDYYSELIK